MNIVAVTFQCLVIAQLAYSQETTQREKATAGHDEIIWQLRAAYAAFNRGDFDAAVAALDPKIEWTEPPEFHGGGTCHGREAVKKYLMQSGAGWAEGSSESERFITGRRSHLRFPIRCKIIALTSDENCFDPSP